MGVYGLPTTENLFKQQVPKFERGIRIQKNTKHIHSQQIHATSTCNTPYYAIQYEPKPQIAEVLLGPSQTSMMKFFQFYP